MKSKVTILLLFILVFLYTQPGICLDSSPALDSTSNVSNHRPDDIIKKVEARYAVAGFSGLSAIALCQIAPVRGVSGTRGHHANRWIPNVTRLQQGLRGASFSRPPAEWRLVRGHLEGEGERNV